MCARTCVCAHVSVCAHVRVRNRTNGAIIRAKSHTLGRFEKWGEILSPHFFNVAECQYNIVNGVMASSLLITSLLSIPDKV